jgi:hypothetical protein
MIGLDDALHDLRRHQRETWAEEAARGFATPETDGQLRDVWELRELLSHAAHVLAVLQVERPHDPNLGAAVASVTHAHSHVYQVERARHRELGSVAPGERKPGSVASAPTDDPTPGEER